MTKFILTPPFITLLDKLAERIKHHFLLDALGDSVNVVTVLFLVDVRNLVIGQNVIHYFFSGDLPIHAELANSACYSLFQ